MAKEFTQDEVKKQGQAVTVDPYGRTYDANGNYAGPMNTTPGYSHGSGPASGGLISTKLDYENIGPNAAALNPINNTAQHDYLRDIGQFSSRIPGLINSVEGGPGKINTFGDSSPVYDAIQNRSNQQYSKNLGNFKNKLNRDEYQMQDKLLGYESQRTQASLAYHSAVEEKKKAQEAAKKAKRAQVLGSVLSVWGAVMGNSEGLQKNSSEW